MSGFLSRLLRRERTSPESAPPREVPEWASEEADLRRQIKTLKVAYALRTISGEHYEDRLRKLERRLAELDP
ncbi:MAG: hypothetical protein ACR2N6_09005 [Miltoncostaeaceae bacterium]